VKLPAGDPARRAAARRRRRTDRDAAARRLDKPVWSSTRVRQGLVPGRVVLSEDVYYSYGNFIPVRRRSRAGCRLHHARVGAGASGCMGIRSHLVSDPPQLLLQPPHVRCDRRVSLPCSGWGSCSCTSSGSPGITPSSGLEIARASGTILQGKFILRGSPSRWVRRVLRGMVRQHDRDHDDDYIRTARPRPSERRVIFKHGPARALTPRHHAGLDLANVIGPLHHRNLFAPGDRSARRRSIGRNDFRW